MSFPWCNHGSTDVRLCIFTQTEESYIIHIEASSHALGHQGHSLRPPPPTHTFHQWLPRCLSPHPNHSTGVYFFKVGCLFLTLWLKVERKFSIYLDNVIELVQALLKKYWGVGHIVQERGKQEGGHLSGSARLLPHPTQPLTPSQATLKESLFPVQRVAIIVASREAAKFLFFYFFSPLCIEMVKKNAGGKNREI